MFVDVGLGVHIDYSRGEALKFLAGREKLHTTCEGASRPALLSLSAPALLIAPAALYCCGASLHLTAV